MGVLENIKKQSANTVGSTSRQTEDRPKAMLWLNIGYQVNGKTVNLPVGIPLDTTEALPVRGNNEDWVALTNARNELLEALQQKGMSLEPGAEVEIPGLQVFVRRVSGPTEVASEDNPYKTDLASILG